MPPARRRPAGPDTDALAALSSPPPAGGRLKKADHADPVLGLASQPRPSVAEPGREAAGDPPAATAAATRPRAAARSKQEDVSRTGGAKVKVGYYQDPDDMARARSAYDWTRPREGHRSLSDFIAHAVMREVERVEKLYNDGQPWPPLEPGELPGGRPLGS